MVRLAYRFFHTIRRKYIRRLIGISGIGLAALLSLGTLLASYLNRLAPK